MHLRLQVGRQSWVMNEKLADKSLLLVVRSGAGGEFGVKYRSSPDWRKFSLNHTTWQGMIFPFFNPCLSIQTYLC